MRDRQPLDKALERLVISANKGRREKARLAAQLAKMPASQLRKVNPSVFATLGPNGMKLFANAKGQDSGLQPEAKPTEKPKGPSLFQRLCNRPWLKGISTALLICAAGIGLARTVAFVVDAGHFESAETYQGWPVCPRLDLARNGCVYFTHLGNLAIEQITALTGLSAEIIVGANPHIDFHYRLPRRAMLIVPGASYR